MRSNFFPPFQWLKSYRLKDLGSDAFSGITLAAYAISVAMAYASMVSIDDLVNGSTNGTS